MSLDSHIEQLKFRHSKLESELEELAASPSVDDIRLVELKRKKLNLKDEIERLKSKNGDLH